MSCTVAVSIVSVAYPESVLTQNPVLRAKQGKVYDLMTCLNSVEHTEGKEKPTVSLKSRDVMSCRK